MIQCGSRSHCHAGACLNDKNVLRLVHGLHAVLKDADQAVLLFIDRLRRLIFLLAAGGDVVLWGGVALMVIWIGLRAAMRLRYENSEEGAAAAVGRAGSRLDILVIVIAGLALSEIVPNFLGGIDAMRLDLSSPPVVEKVKFRMMHVYEDKSRRWASDRRDAVFLRENGEELTIPAPVTKSFDEQEPLRAATAAKPDDAMEITYYPHCKTVVSVRPL